MKELEDLKKALERMRTSSNDYSLSPDYIREMEEVYTDTESYKEFFSFCQTIFGDIEENE